MRPLNLVCISRDGLLHSERRITRAHGMILVGDGRAKEGHNPIAHNPVHGALIAVDRLNHALEHRVEELLRVLRVAVSKQLHRALNIREQHGDLLPLTLEGCPGGEDLIGKMLRRVILRRGKARIVPNGTQGKATLGAVLGCERYPTSTVRTGSGQWSSTLLAELCLSTVLVLALRAFHCRLRRKKRAAPLSSVMNSRRLMPNMGPPPRHTRREWPPAVEGPASRFAAGSAYRKKYWHVLRQP